MCAHCGVRMVGHLGSDNAVRCFQCEVCRRTISGTYADVLREESRPRRAGRRAVRPPELDQMRQRLDRWLAALEDQDPYRILGVSPTDPADAIRRRYRELAFQCHPDRGGSVEKMAELNRAYERITSHHERRKQDVE
jgi:hypothetical protein